MSASTVSTFKACEGGGAIVKLAPMRMADAVQKTPAATSSATKPGGYLPPHMRKTGSSQDTSASVVSLDTTSAYDFPTLSVATSSVTASASWTQIRTRFQAPAATDAQPPAAAPTANTNQFAALDEDAGPAASKGGAIDFKQVIKDRIKREEAERMGVQQEEPTDPQLMTREQLERKGWAVLSLPPRDVQGRKVWFADYAARQAAKEAGRDKEFEALCEIFAPAGTVEPELRQAAKQQTPLDIDDTYESEPENEFYDEPTGEIEAY